MASQEGPAVGRSGGRQHRQVPPSGRDHGAVDAQLVATAWLAHSHVSTSIPTGAAHSPGEGPITAALSRAREKEEGTRESLSRRCPTPTQQARPDAERDTFVSTLVPVLKIMGPKGFF